MPRGHGRTSSNVEKVAYWKNRSLDRTIISLGERNYKFFSQEHHISALVMGNTEQRCIIFTFVAPDLDAYFKLATILQSFESPDKRNHCPSAALPESTPTIIFAINLQKEHRTNLSGDAGLPDSSSAWSSSGLNVMSQSRNRNKRTESLKDYSDSSASKGLTVDASSGSLCESLSPLGSDHLVSDISKVERPLKKRSKKKGKKKGKNYKRSSSKKDSTELGHCEESTCSSPAAETSTGCSPTCFPKQILDNFSEKLSFPPTFIDKNIRVQKNDCETNYCADSSTTMQSCLFYDDEMEKFETSVSPFEGFVLDELTNNSTGEPISISSTTESPESVLSTDCVNIKGASPKQGINCNNKSLSISMNLYDDDDDDDAVLGSVRDRLKNDFSGNCSNDVATSLPIKYKCGLDTSPELDSDFRRCDLSFHGAIVESSGVNNEVSNAFGTSDSHRSYGVVNADSIERALCSGQACSTNDFHYVLSGKRGRAGRKLTVQTGKDNTNPVWQKVQKMENPSCINTPNTVCAVFPKVDTLDSGARERLDASSVFTQKLKTGKYPYEISRESSESSEINVKKKHISVSKQVKHYSMKGSYNGTVDHARHSKIHVHQKEGLKILPQANHDEHTSSGLSSPCNAGSPIHVVKSTEKCDLIDMEGHGRCSDFSLYENMRDECCVMDSTDNQHKKSSNECSHTESTNNNFGPVLQKWVPVVRKAAAMPPIEHVDNLTASVVDECSSMLGIKKDDVVVRSEVQCLVSSTRMEVQHFRQSGDGADCSSSETDTLSNKLTCCSPTAGGLGVSNELNCQFASELRDQQFAKFETELDTIDQQVSKFETGLGKIVCSVNDTCKLQSATCDHLSSGSPLAEFERFMRSASPVISQMHHNRICMTCPGKQEHGTSVCSHQIHNISLASLWQWYEEPGCYGLEVRADDNHKSKRLRDGFVEFRAYFVPYLSAVQLFGQSGYSYANFSTETTMMSCEVDQASKPSSNLSSIPMFSVLLPRPRMEVNECPLESTSSSINEFFSQSAKDTNLTDGELIFEYFEHAQPPQRRPLFEKIRELVNGDQSSNSQIYGDPLKLECLSLHDLHPASWYAVAWYPIYRIPEGNFRAAFLTYHSLGHFVHQSASSNLVGDFTRIISPVVGLQSYNAKKECWFQPRDLNSMDVEKGEALMLSPKLLEERLRTLEQTAYVMATAAVRKGNKRSINNHPDYNHFLSRW